MMTRRLNVPNDGAPMLLSNYSIRFRVAVFVLVGVLSVAGTIAYLTLPREGAPAITIPFVFVTAIYEGTAPEEMEKIVTIPIEKQLKDVEHIKEMRSTTREGMTLVQIEFDAGNDIDRAKQQVKDKVDLARPDLPDDLDEPMVQAINFSSDVPIMILALSGQADLARLRFLAEALEDEIESLPGVKDVTISGVQEREIRIEVDLFKLATYEIPLGLIMQRVAAENRTVSAGNLEAGVSKFQVRVPGEFALARDLRDLLLIDRPAGPVYLSDVAAVIDTTKDIDSIARLNGETALSLTLRKRTGINTVRLADAVQASLSAFPLPPGVRLTTVFDESRYVRMMVSELENNVASGFILVVLVLCLFMGFRNSLLVAIAIPLSLMIGFVVLAVMDQTLNMIVLFSLVLAVGMLVDNGIVIVENIYRNQALGMSRVDAARTGAAEVAWPVLTSTATTLAAFGPLLFWPGIMGQFMGILPETLIVVLTSSLFVALVVNPAVCSVLIRPAKRHLRTGALGEPDHPIMDYYERFLHLAIRYPGRTIMTGIVMLVASVVLYARFSPGVELFPDTEPKNATVSVRFPQGTRIDHTDAAMRRIEAGLTAFQDIAFFLTTVGQGSAVGDISIGGGAAHEGRIHIEFADQSLRQGSSRELVDRIRDMVGRIPGADVTVERQKEGPPVAAPIAIELAGDDFDTLSGLARDAMRLVETIDGLVDLQDDIDDALPELQFHVDRQRAALVGLNTDAIGAFLRTAIFGSEVSRYRVGQDEYDISVRLPVAQRDTAGLMDRLWIPLADGRRIAMSSLGSVIYAGGRGAIHRKDQKRMVTITGNNRKDVGVDVIQKEAARRLAGMSLPRGYRIAFTGEDKEKRESMAFLGKAFFVALGLIFVILVMEFNSILLPGIVMTSVVMSLMGVLLGLNICRMKFGIIMTGVGVISLAGVVVNNAIVLIDCITQRILSGVDEVTAVIQAGRLRLRPVLLTAATTILGLIPMAIGYSLEVHTWPPRLVAGSETSDWWAPMAVVVIFGLAVSTLLTLVFVPTLYLINRHIERRLMGSNQETPSVNP